MQRWCKMLAEMHLQHVWIFTRYVELQTRIAWFIWSNHKMDRDTRVFPTLFNFMLTRPMECRGQQIGVANTHPSWQFMSKPPSSNISAKSSWLSARAAASSRSSSAMVSLKGFIAKITYYCERPRLVQTWISKTGWISQFIGKRSMLVWYPKGDAV